MDRKKAFLLLCLLPVILLVSVLKTFDLGSVVRAAGPANEPVWIEERIRGVVEIGLSSPDSARTPSQIEAKGDYRISTSLTDPLCDTGFDGYVNLEDHGIFPKPEAEGDSKGWLLFSNGEPFNFYGNEYPEMIVSDDGIIIFDIENYAGPTWEAQNVPDSGAPDNLAAIFWQDFEIVYDRDSYRGLSTATYGDNVVLVEYDNVQLHGDPRNTYDFEIIMTRAVDDAPGAYEIVYAYDNLDGVLEGPFTVGVENNDGTAAAVLLNLADASGIIENKLVVCLDYDSGASPNTPTAEPTETPTATASATPTSTPTSTATATATTMPAASPTASSTASASSSPAASPTPTSIPGSHYAGTPVFLPVFLLPR